VLVCLYCCLHPLNVTLSLYNIWKAGLRFNAGSTNCHPGDPSSPTLPHTSSFLRVCRLSGCPARRGSCAPVACFSKMRFTDFLLAPSPSWWPAGRREAWKGAQTFFSVCYLWALAAPFARAADSQFTSPESTAELRRQQQQARADVRRQRLQEGRQRVLSSNQTHQQWLPESLPANRCCLQRTSRLFRSKGMQAPAPAALSPGPAPAMQCWHSMRRNVLSRMLQRRSSSRSRSAKTQLSRPNSLGQN
jgi:hypothetical protein